MKVIGLDGKEYVINLTKYSIPRNDDRLRSKGHLEAREILRTEFPSRTILEEVYLSSEKLYLDFFEPSARIAVEIQGEQHNKFISHFHGTKLSFYKAKARDRRKREFCQLNNITLIELYDNESRNEWIRKIRSRGNSSNDVERQD
jgi:hypothetical protein